MQQACSARDFREIFRLVNRRTGSSHAAMAAAIGKMSSSRVSDIIRGVRGIRGREVVERVADGFGIPGEMIGLPRRSWESASGDGGESAALLEIRCAAAPLEDQYRDFDGPAVDFLREQLEVAKHDDGALGARKSLSLVLGLLSAVERRAREVKPSVRRELLSAGADGAEFAGWLYRDIRQPVEAVFWYDRAVEWAQEANDPAMQGYMLLKKSQMAYDDGDAARMVTLAQAGQHGRWRLPARVRAELTQQEALGCAMLGEPFSLVERNLGAARELLADAAVAEPGDLGAYFNEHTLSLRNAVSYTEAGRPGLAADLFGRIMEAGTLSRRDMGFFNGRRSAALALSGEPDEAARIGRASAEVARAMKSARTLRVLDEVAQTLRRWRSRPAVREFREALQAV